MPGESVRGIVVGDSQVKFLQRVRIPLLNTVNVVTFSFGGATTETLRSLLRGLGLRRQDFIAVYVGGNDLFIQGNDPVSVIVARVEELVEELHDYTSNIFIYKIIPRGDALGHEREADRLHLNRLFVRRLTRLGARILNVDHLFLNTQRKPRLDMLAMDQYHACRVRGIQALAFVLSRGVAALFGSEHRGRAEEAAARFEAPFCVECRAKGHHRGECTRFRVAQKTRTKEQDTARE